MKKDYWVQTYGDGIFDLQNPSETLYITPRAIAHSLSNLPRFAGHTHIRWSVAHHVMTVDTIIDQLAHEDSLPRIRPYALLHDAAEVITGDIPAPVINHMKDDLGFDFRTLVELPILQQIYNAFKLPAPLAEDLDLIREADAYALRIERRELMDSSYRWAIDSLRIPSTVEQKLFPIHPMPTMRRILTEAITESLREFHAFYPAE